MISLIIGSCIMLEGLVWEVGVEYLNEYKLNYYTKVRIKNEYNTRMIEVSERRSALFKKDYLLINFKKTKRNCHE